MNKYELMNEYIDNKVTLDNIFNTYVRDMKMPQKDAFRLICTALIIGDADFARHKLKKTPIDEFIQSEKYIIFIKLAKQSLVIADKFAEIFNVGDTYLLKHSINLP